MTERQTNPEIIFTSFDRYTRFVVDVDQQKLGQFLQQELGMSQEQLANLNVRFYGVGMREQGTEHILAGQFYPGGRLRKDSASIYVGSLVWIAREYQDEIKETKSLERPSGSKAHEAGLELSSPRWTTYLNSK